MAVDTVDSKDVFPFLDDLWGWISSQFLGSLDNKSKMAKIRDT